jgi:BirA family biotin operon repressor/biotin-[acetyl-CoA-carboxylase] ligase
MFAIMFDQAQWFHYAEVGSTNTVLHEKLSRQRLPEGSVVMADYQTSGRGQRGNHWASSRDKNLLMSMVLYPPFKMPNTLFLLNKCIALAVYDLFINHSNHIHIKWPNDILFNEKKIAGILIENFFRGQEYYATIVGIGINLNQQVFADDLKKATSLLNETGIASNPKMVAIELHESIGKYFEIFKKNDFDWINSRYQERLYRLNETTDFYSNNLIFSGRIKGVSESGMLIVEDNDSNELCFDVREIKFKDWADLP